MGLRLLLPWQHGFRPPTAKVLRFLEKSGAPVWAASIPDCPRRTTLSRAINHVLRNDPCSGSLFRIELASTRQAHILKLCFPPDRLGSNEIAKFFRRAHVHNRAGIVEAFNHRGVG